jgi:hypothetical protein
LRIVTSIVVQKKLDIIFTDISKVEGVFFESIGQITYNHMVITYFIEVLNERRK